MGVTSDRFRHHLRFIHALPYFPVLDWKEPMNTRELWLEKATEKLRTDFFAPIGEIVPPVRVSIGFPGGGSPRKTVGEYWKSVAVKDGVPQVFISPVKDCPIEILDILVHELVHAIVPDAGHKAPFKRIALAVGLTGKMRSTVAGPKLKARLNELARELGPIPQSAIILGEGRKKQSTRMIKVECSDCGYVARTTRQWLETIGAPLCACNNEQMKPKEK
jgi:hypothetical protein